MAMIAPKLRFDGYAEAWEERKLGACAGTTYGGGTPRTDDPSLWNGDIPWIQSSNVLEGELLSIEIPKAITETGLAKSAAQMVPSNSIAVVTHVGVGKLVYLPFSYTTSQDFVSLSELNTNPIFTCYALYRRLQSELHMVQGSAIKGITKEELLGKSIFVPPTEEQERIGNTFQQLDKLITLHQREHDKLDTAKQSLLQRMFPKAGEAVPEVRFEGFDSTWNQFELSELFSFQNGFNGSSEAFGSGTPLISVMDVLDNGFITHDKIRGKAELNEDELKRFSVEYGDVLFQRSSETFEEAGTSNVYLDKTATAAFGGFVIRGKKIADYDPVFIKYALTTAAVRSQIVRQAQGAQHINVSQNTLANVQVLMPSIEEQVHIGAILRNMDDLIELRRQELMILRHIKMAFMQKMFV